MVWPTTPRKGLQALVSKWSTADSSGFALVIDESGGVAFMVGDGDGGVASVSIGKPMVEYEWYLAAGDLRCRLRHYHRAARAAGRVPDHR